MTKRITKVMPKKPVVPARKRICAYTRVSSGKDAMLHSLSAQVSYYSSYIRKNPEWEYAGVYTDEALTGTKGNRQEFQRMLRDCRDGKIDMIITKSISRFARNTVTLLETVRELKALGVDVYFEEQNIHSMSGDGELMLTILASYAQEESRSVSENCKWRIREKMKQGISSSTRINGYSMKHGEITIIPAEAAIVRLIFNYYLSGMGKNAIARALNDAGIPAKNGGLWNESTIEGILRNEKYRGDLLLQKSYREDHLSKKKCCNRGELPKYLVEDHHEAIISRGDFEQVQKRKMQQAERFGNGISKRGKYPFTGKLICGNCGKPYRRRHNSGKIAWQCTTFMVHGKKYCSARQVQESVLESLAAEVLSIDNFDPAAFCREIDHVCIFNDNRIVFNFYAGRVEERVWQNPSRRDSWTPEMKQRAAEHAGRRNVHV